MIQFRSNQRIHYVSLMDPALDTERLDVNQYVKDLKWKEFIREGQTPTVFHLVRLTRAQCAAVDRADPADRNSVRVSFGLKQIDNLSDPNGHPVVLETQPAGEQGEKLKKESLDRIHSPELFAELSSIIHLLSGLDPLAGSPSR